MECGKKIENSTRRYNDMSYVYVRNTIYSSSIRAFYLDYFSKSIAVHTLSLNNDWRLESVWQTKKNIIRRVRYQPY